MTPVRRVVASTTLEPGRVYTLFDPRTGHRERVEFVRPPELYRLERMPDRSWEMHEPLTGVRCVGRDFMEVRRAFGEALRSHRDALAARDPATLDAEERAQLDKLRGFSRLLLGA